MPETTTSDGRAVVYEDYGAGPPVVLVHGSPGTAQAWAAAGERLADGFRILAPNLPGYGGSAPRPPDTDPETGTAAAAVEAVIGKAGAPVVLVGHSYGGNVCLNVALRGTVELAGLILFEPVALMLLQAAGHGAHFVATKAAFDDYIASQQAGEPRAVGKMVAFWFGAGAFDAMPKAMQDYLDASADLNVLDVRATFAERHSLDALAALALPTLVVYGGASPPVTVEIARTIADTMPRADLACIEGATHALTTTHAEAVADLIAERASTWLR